MKSQYLKFCILTFVGVCTFNLTLNAQVYQNVKFGQNGTGMVVRSKNNNSGTMASTYLFDDWRPGKVQFADGAEPIAGEIKYDLVDNVLVVKGEGGVENTFTSPVKMFSIQNTSGDWLVYNSGYTGKDITPTDFFREMYGGVKVKAFEREQRALIESKGYNTGSTFKLETTRQYYIKRENSNELILVKRDAKSLAEALNAPALVDFAKVEKLNFKKDEDFRKFFAYYETL